MYFLYVGMIENLPCGVYRFSFVKIGKNNYVGIIEILTCGEYPFFLVGIEKINVRI